jgi:hypothetical protein
MGLFSKIKEAKSTQGGEYIRPGNYLFQVQRVKVQESQVGSRTFFLAELRTIESEAVDDDTKPNAVNTDCTYIVELTGDYPDMALGNVKAFLKEAYSSLVAPEEGPADEDIDEEMADDAIGEENPLAGVFLSCKAFNKPTRKGNDFTRVKWSVPENVTELAVAS